MKHFLILALPLALLLGGCAADHPIGPSPGQASTGGAPGGFGGAGRGGGSGGIGEATGGAAGQNPGTACEVRNPTMFWSLTPAVSALSGTVARKEIGADGSENLAIADDRGVEHNLALGVPLSAPIATGERIDIRAAERRVFSIYRTLEIRKDGEPILYATEVEQPDLPPPLRLEVGDHSCASRLFGVTTHHRLRAYDGDQAVTIEVGQQAEVGRFRVYNDLIQRFPSGTDDVIDTLRVGLVRVR